MEMNRPTTCSGQTHGHRLAMANDGTLSPSPSFTRPAVRIVSPGCSEVKKRVHVTLASESSSCSLPPAPWRNCLWTSSPRLSNGFLLPHARPANPADQASDWLSVGCRGLSWAVSPPPPRCHNSANFPSTAAPLLLLSWIPEASHEHSIARPGGSLHTNRPPLPASLASNNTLLFKFHVAYYQLPATSYQATASHLAGRMLPSGPSSIIPPLAPLLPAQSGNSTVHEDTTVSNPAQSSRTPTCYLHVTQANC